MLATLLLEKDRLNCCIVVNSGASIQDIRAPLLLFNKAEWKGVQRKAYEDFHKNDEGSAEIRALFSLTFLGNDRIMLREQLKELYNRLFLIIGARDEVFTLGQVMDIGPGQTGLAVLQVPLLGHWIGVNEGDKPTWELWRGFIARAILAFEEHHPARNKFTHLLDLCKGTLSELQAGCEDTETLSARILRADHETQTLTLLAVTSNLSTGPALREAPPWGRGVEGKLIERVRETEGKKPEWHWQLVDLEEQSPESLGYDEPEAQLFREEGIRTLAVTPLRLRSTPFCMGTVTFCSTTSPGHSILHTDAARGEIRDAAGILTALMQKHDD